MQSLRTLKRETTDTDMEYEAAMFAEAAGKFYYHNLSPKLAKDFGLLILKAFKEEPCEVGEPSRIIAAGMWSEGFLFKPPETDAKAKLLNPNWAVDYPVIKMDPVEVYEGLVNAGHEVLKNPRHTEQFEKWLGDISLTKY